MYYDREPRPFPLDLWEQCGRVPADIAPPRDPDRYRADEYIKRSHKARSVVSRHVVLDHIAALQQCSDMWR